MLRINAGSYENRQRMYALFDTGASHSLIAEEFVARNGLMMVTADVAMKVVYADGRHGTTSQVCENCQV